MVFESLQTATVHKGQKRVPIALVGWKLANQGHRAKDTGVEGLDSTAQLAISGHHDDRSWLWPCWRASATSMSSPDPAAGTTRTPGTAATPRAAPSVTSVMPGQRRIGPAFVPRRGRDPRSWRRPADRAAGVPRPPGRATSRPDGSRWCSPRRRADSGPVRSRGASASCPRSRDGAAVGRHRPRRPSARRRSRPRPGAEVSPRPKRSPWCTPSRRGPRSRRSRPVRTRAERRPPPPLPAARRGVPARRCQVLRRADPGAAVVTPVRAELEQYIRPAGLWAASEQQPGRAEPAPVPMAGGTGDPAVAASPHRSDARA